MSDICKWYIAILIYSARSIKQHSAGRHVAPLGQVNLIQVNQSFLLHFNDTHCFFLETINKKNYSLEPTMYHKRVSEWLLFNANSAIFQLIFNEMMMRSTLYLNNTLSWISIVACSLKSPHSEASS